MSGNDETVLVCVRITAPLMMPDNLTGECRDCGAKVQFRPHAPKIPRLCMDCALDQIDEVTEIFMTRRTLEELRDRRDKRRS